MLGRSLLDRVLANDAIHECVARAYFATYPGSRAYWRRRYETGADSGAGSYGALAEFKAETIEAFVEEHDVESVVEFGCGDGNQVALTDLPDYVGLDVSPTAVRECVERFEDDDSKSFFLYDSMAFRDNHDVFTAELGLSLDVLFHLTEEEVYQRYMRHLFGSAEAYVLVYSSNSPAWNDDADHVRHRRFTDWPERHADAWELVETIENEYPWDPSRPEETSRSDFYVFEKR